MKLGFGSRESFARLAGRRWRRKRRWGAEAGVHHQSWAKEGPRWAMKATRVNGSIGLVSGGGGGWRRWLSKSKEALGGTRVQSGVRPSVGRKKQGRKKREGEYDGSGW